MAATDASGGDGLKKRALVRLAVAGGVTALALAGLWWLDRQGSAPPAATQAPPKPIVHAPPPEPLPPPAEAEVVPVPPPETAPDVAATTTEAPSPAAPQARPAPPPPPRVSNDVALPASPRQAAPQPSGTPPAAAVPKQPAAVLPAKAGEFVVQMGVFSNPDYALELVRRLRAQGIRAHVETRVHVGPFRNRQEADQARAEMLRMGFKGVVAAGPSP